MNNKIRDFVLVRGVFVSSSIIILTISLLSLAITLISFHPIASDAMMKLMAVSFLTPLAIGFPVVYMMLNMIRQLDTAEREMRELATKDHLTGVWNRGYFIEAAEKWDKQSLRHERPLSLMIIDFDLFKKINDTYGHVAGDNALRAFATEAQKVIRASDTLGRIGGEEFATLMPDCPGMEACRAAERLREAVSKLTIKTDSGDVTFTISVGVASYPKNPGYDRLSVAADTALYAAKRDGRNKVRVNENSCHGCKGVNDPCELRFAVA